MLLNDYYKTYKMSESDDTFMIEKIMMLSIMTS